MINLFVFQFLNEQLTPEDEFCRKIIKELPGSGAKSFLAYAYLPSVFHSIRRLSYVDENKFLDEWNPSHFAAAITDESAGKSGSLFLVSHSQTYLLKTLNKGEKKKMVEMATDLQKV